MSETNNNSQITKLRDHMFSQLDRLNDPACDLDKELKKAQATVQVGNVIVNSVKAEIDFMRVNKLMNQKEKTPRSKQLENAK